MRNAEIRTGSVDEEKIGTANGLCQSPNCDDLFEDGTSSFTDDGNSKVSVISKAELDAYGLTGSENIELVPRQTKYLSWHRKHKYIGK